MRILYLCHRIPYPPDKGDKIRAFYELKALSSRHEVDVFTLADDPRDLAYRSALAGYCNRLTVARLYPKLARLKALPCFLTQKPLTVPYFYSAELRAAIREACLQKPYERIFVYCSAMAQYIEWANAAPAIVDLVDVDSDKWTQYAAYARFPFSAVYRREGRVLREYERQVCENARFVLVTTEREARLVPQVSGGSRVRVIPNGVDSDYFAPATRAETQAASESPMLTFTGDMAYFPNEEAVIFLARRVLPLIRQDFPSVGFSIVGRNPSAQVRKLGEMAGVEVTGFVPDVRTWLKKTTIAVAPFSIASGIQNKILEAMACGLPVVATTRAAQGLSERVAAAVELGDTAPEIAARIVSLLRDPELRQSKGMEGRRRVMAEYNWERSLGSLLELLENLQPQGVSSSEAQSSRA